MYMWMNWIIAPKVNAEVAEVFGEAPAQSKLRLRRDAADEAELLRPNTTPKTRRSGSASTTGRRRSPTAANGGERLQGLQRLGPGLDRDQGLIEQVIVRPMATERRSPQKRSAGRRLADLFHGRPRLQVGALLAGPVGWLVDRLPGLARGPADRRLLDASTPLSGELIKSFSFDNFEDALQRTGLPRRSSCRTVRIAAAGHRHRRDARLPDRLLHGEGREPPRQGDPRRRGADAALVELPGQGLRLADDALRRTG